MLFWGLGDGAWVSGGGGRGAAHPPPHPKHYYLPGSLLVRRVGAARVVRFWSGEAGWGGAPPPPPSPQHQIHNHLIKY